MNKKMHTAIGGIIEHGSVRPVHRQSDGGDAVALLEGYHGVSHWQVADQHVDRVVFLATAGAANETTFSFRKRVIEA
jgi:hypothetical protein